MNFKNISMEPLTKEEIINIGGGDIFAYDVGYFLGYMYQEFRESMANHGGRMYAIGSPGGAK